jgi:hypothetical protein
VSGERDLPGEEELRTSQPNATGPDRAAGGMGVSSERTGPAGPGQEATDGTRDTTPQERDPDADVPPEQAPGQVEANPEGLPPKAGYSSVDPRSE